MAQFVITTSKKKVSQKAHINKTTTAESLKSQDDGRMRSDEANMLEERCDEVESKIKQEGEAAATAQKPNEIESAAVMKQAEGGIVAEAAAAHNLGEDANAAEAKEKAKKTGDRSQNNENEKIKDGDDEIRSLIEERRSIAKGDRQQLREVSKTIKQCISDRKKNKKQDKIQRILEDNSEASRTSHA